MSRHSLDTLLEKIRARCVWQNGCLVWQGWTSGKGYGRIVINGRASHVHRVVYELVHGPLPSDLTVDHVAARGCVSRACCNIAHLEAVTVAVNVLRGNSASAMNARKTHCASGHPLAGDNLDKGQLRLGQRRCRLCRRARENTARKARRDAAAVGGR